MCIRLAKPLDGEQSNELRHHNPPRVIRLRLDIDKFIGEVGMGWWHSSAEAIPRTQQVLRTLVSQGRAHLEDTRGAHTVKLRVVVVQQHALILHPAHGLEQATVVLRMYTTA